MKSLSSIFLSVALLLLFQLNVAALPPCNGEGRWSIKVLTDPEAAHIDQTPKTASINELIKVRPQYSETGQRADVERQTYEVTCRIAGYKLESDGDIHIVMMDVNDNSVTMIAEIPNPDCPNVSGSPSAAKFRQARAQIASYTVDRKKGEEIRKVTRGLYKLVGVGFMDEIHGQLGVAPNGIELHPLMSVTKVE